MTSRFFYSLPFLHWSNQFRLGKHQGKMYQSAEWLSEDHGNVGLQLIASWVIMIMHVTGDLVNVQILIEEVWVEPEVLPV